MVYMIIASIACAIQAGHQGGVANSAMLLSILVSYGRELVFARSSDTVCLVLTPRLYAVYAFSSLLAFDPWHMFTSFIPYLLLSPMYINVLNMWVVPQLRLTDPGNS